MEPRIDKRPDNQLKAFEKCVNESAKQLCLKDVSFLNRRSTLLELARKRVGEEGYSRKATHGPKFMAKQKVVYRNARSTTKK